MVSISLKHTRGFTYLLDEDSNIISCNDNLAKLLALEPEDLQGKRFSDLPICSGWILDSNNTYLIYNKIEYEDFIEVMLPAAKKYNAVTVNSHKRLLFDRAGQILGLLNESNPINENINYDPSYLYSLANDHIAIEIKEKLNALYTFNKQLQLITPHLAQECAIDHMDKLINDLNDLSQKILFARNEAISCIKMNTATNFRYKGILIVNRVNNFFLSATMNSRTFDLELVSIQDFMAEKSLMHRVQDAFYHIVILDNQSMSRINSRSFFESCIHATMIVELLEPNRIPNLNTEHNYIEMHEIIDFDHNIFFKWRAYVDQMVAKNINNSSSFFILLVDSDSYSRDSLAQLFAMQKLVKIKTARNAQEALLLVKITVFDLIIVELSLSDFSGLELIKKIRIIQHEERFLACPIFVHSLSDIFLNDYYLYGIDAVYIKPSIATNIESIIKKYILNGAPKRQ